MQYAEYREKKSDDKRFKQFLDYLGSYTDPKRANEELKASYESGPDGSEESSTQVVYRNDNFGKEDQPIVKMESEEAKVKFLTNFDKAMREKFGDTYEEVEVVTPAKVEDPDDNEPDEIIVR